MYSAPQSVHGASEFVELLDELTLYCTYQTGAFWLIAMAWCLNLYFDQICGKWAICKLLRSGWNGNPMEMLKVDLPLVSSADIPNIENYLGRQAVDNINLFKAIPPMVKQIYPPIDKKYSWDCWTNTIEYITLHMQLQLSFSSIRAAHLSRRTFSSVPTQASEDA